MENSESWQVVGNAGGAFTKSGDLWVAHWIRSPKGKLLVKVTTVGFRDLPEGRRKVVLDCKVQKPTIEQIHGKFASQIN